MHNPDILLAACIGLIPSIFTFAKSKWAERAKRAIQNGRNELDGRRVSMDEIQLVIENLKDDLRRSREDMEAMRREFDDFRAQHMQEKTEAQQTIAQLQRDLVKEQRRSNRLHDELADLRRWLNQQGIQGAPEAEWVEEDVR